jgi:hypothetical protein
MKLWRLAALAALMAAGEYNGLTQDDDGRALAVFADLKNAAQSGRREPQEAVFLYTSISGLVDQLYERYRGRARGSPGLSGEYIKSLSDDSTALKEANTSEPKKMLQTVGTVRDDLQVKVRFQGGFGAGGAFPSIIKVTVETRRQSAKADHLWVRCNPLRYGTTKVPMFPFNDETSPTSARLPPGLFWIWVESTDHSQVLLQQPVTIGTTTQNNETIRLALP